MGVGDQRSEPQSVRSGATAAKHASTAGLPVSTWVIGTAAFLIVLTAGALFLDKEPEAESPADAQAEPNEKAVEPSPVERLKAKKGPLDLTASLLDASERSKLWKSDAALAGVELVVVDGKPTGPIEYTFGSPVGRSAPGVVLSSGRHKIRYDKKSVEEESFESTERKVALPEPTCPLEVALRTLAQGQASPDGRVGVLYLHSEKHGKPIWLVTDEAGEATPLSSESCALLRK